MHFRRFCVKCIPLRLRSAPVRVCTQTQGKHTTSRTRGSFSNISNLYVMLWYVSSQHTPRSQSRQQSPSTVLSFHHCDLILQRWGRKGFFPPLITECPPKSSWKNAYDTPNLCVFSAYGTDAQQPPN